MRNTDFGGSSAPSLDVSLPRLRRAFVWHRAAERSIHLFHLTPAGFLELHGRVVDLAAVYLFVLVGDIVPGTEAQRHPIAGPQAPGRGEHVVAHALGVNNGFQTSSL